ncbi:apolipoprotein N-acyltransferase [Candidatus Methylopumilus planktonicus]|uniref:apolipoprotein N-acyltransferase n=1 Tax=Candidatus Methylopumilus planktonicus TaxID=1581557 RepID=UPI0011234FA6|nr:apolipoprotein N-acyltransferase [Candidatus Methylopumilus planktonicus]QDD01976.1 apolipoprotein N-acyltransferase [Candidatus Methylopumilus planktonicus]
MNKLYPLFYLVISFWLGALSVLSFAPFNHHFISLISLSGLFFIWHKLKSARQGFFSGLFFGLGLFGFGISWIYISLNTYGGMPSWLSCLSTFLFCLFCASFFGIIGWFSLHRKSSLFLIPFFWTFIEWIKGWLFTGFPWLTMGYSQVPSSPLVGFLPIIGIYGLTLILTSLALLLSFTLLSKDKRSKLLKVSLVAAVLASGQILKYIEWTEPTGEPISISLVQGNIAQDIKWQKETVIQTLQTYQKLIQKTKGQIILLPETALPLLVEYIPETFKKSTLLHAAKQRGHVLIGAIERQDTKYFNVVLNLGNDSSQVYRKSHLVPFGEFIPLKFIFTYIYTHYLNMPMNDLSRGGNRQELIAIENQKIAFNICYEDVFGEEIIQALPSATILANVSNDAWYGRSIAAYQHLQFSQARAIETGRMVIRSTNTGATAIIDEHGIVKKILPAFTEGILEGYVQGFKNTTPYVFCGNWPVIILCFIVLLGWFMRHSKLLWVLKKK